MRSEYWRSIMAEMYVMASRGTEEEEDATWELIDQVHGIDLEMYGSLETPLEEAWYDIKFMINVLQHMNVRDIEEIEKLRSVVFNAIIEINFRKEPWSLRESILEDLYENDWYDEYGVFGDLQLLSESLCTNKKERQIARAMRQDIGIE